MAFDALKGYMDDCMEHYEQTVADLEAQLQVLKQKAEENAKYAIDLLEEC